MREVMIDGKRVIRSPWLRIDEAAVYCGISRAMFDSRAREARLPHGGDERTRLYHVDVLDQWVGGLLDAPFVHLRPAKDRVYGNGKAQAGCDAAD